MQRLFSVALFAVLIEGQSAGRARLVLFQAGRAGAQGGCIEEAKQYVDLNRICLSSQCGFASTEEGNHLTEEQQMRKLAFIKEIAEEI